MEMLTYIALGAAIVLVLGYLRLRFFDFAAQTPADYAGDAGETFDLRTHLNGAMICEGVIYGPTGRVTSRFVADLDARWEGNQGVMDEHFRYETGSEQHRQALLLVAHGGDPRAGRTSSPVVLQLGL